MKSAREFSRKPARVLIHRSITTQIIAGQATAAKELLEEIPDLDAVFAPVSGGGLLSGNLPRRQGTAPRHTRLRLRAGARR